MATKAKRERFERSQEAYRKASALVDALDIHLSVRYGRREWASVAERRSLDKARALQRRCAERVFKALDGAPRDWMHGVPSHWVCGDLTVDDAFRPKTEPLSVTPPIACGSTQAMR